MPKSKPAALQPKDFVIHYRIYVGYNFFSTYTIVSALSPEEALARCPEYLPTPEEAETYGADAYRVVPLGIVGIFSEKLIRDLLTGYLADDSADPRLLDVIEIDKAFHRAEHREESP